MTKVCVAILSITIAFACYGETIDEVLAREILRLSHEDQAVREKAHNAILKLGVKAEAAVAAAHRIATDPEVKHRLAAVLQCYAIEEEDEWALKKLDENQPFPAHPKCEIQLDFSSIATLFARISEASGVKISTFPKDTRLGRLAEETVYNKQGRYKSVQQALNAALLRLEAAYVVDAGAVVVVRMSPAVFFYRLKEQLRQRPTSWLDETLYEFNQPVISHWGTVMNFIQEQVKTGGDTRNKWFMLLRNRAEDEYEEESNRIAALRGLGYFQGMMPEVMPEVDAVFMRQADNKIAPLSVRRAACRGLIGAMSVPAQEALLKLLPGAAPEQQQELLAAMDDKFNHTWSAVSMINQDANRRTKLNAILDGLSNAKDQDVAVRALAMLANRGSKKASERLPDAKPTEDWVTRRMYMAALAKRKDPHLPLGRNREVLDQFAAHKSTDVRSMYAILIGHSAGGFRREADVAALLKLLDDPEPQVRFFAVTGLGLVYSTGAADFYKAGVAEARARLEKMKATEPDTKVKERIERHLEEMHQP